MRRAPLVFGPFVLLAGAVFACEDDGGAPSGPSFLLDASTPTFDGSQPPFDGATPDAEPDAPVVQPPVSVTVFGKAGPEADVRVVFHDANGAVLETKLTGADGKATRSAGAIPAMASALLSQDGSRRIVTWTGVEDGDQLAVHDVDSTFQESMVGAFAVTFPGPFSDAGATSYEARASDCYNYTEGQSTTINLLSYCVSGAKSSVLVQARNGAGDLVGHSFSKGNTVPTDGGTVAVATGAWRVPASVSLSLAGLPSDTYGEMDLLEIADGYGYLAGATEGLETQAIFATASTFADALQASASFYDEEGPGKRVLAKRVAPTAAIALDAAELLPPITSSAVSGTDARRPVLRWTSSSTAGADGGLVRTGFFTPDDAYVAWTFVVPPGSTSVTAPAMPAEAESFLPAAGDAGPADFMPPTVVFIEADVLPSYTAFRRLQGSLVDHNLPFQGYRLPPLPANGAYRATVRSSGDRG
ncbi:MAG: hypothetical protein KF850_03615 [Labilithrix sp.]|nr:hypothetical protein [Labilithrix sp.]